MADTGNMGMQAMFPVVLTRRGEQGDTREIDDRIAQNENNLNQNFQNLYQKVLELEARLGT